MQTAKVDTNDIALPKDSDTAVTVNGVKITEGQINALVEPRINQMLARGQQLPPQLVHRFRQQLRQQATERLIIDVLLGEEVKKQNVTVTDDEVDKQIEKYASQQNMTADQFKAALEQNGQNFDEVKGEIRKGMLYQKIAEAQWEGKINVTDEEAKAYFDSNPEKYATKEQIRASHILIKPDTTGDPNEAKAKALAKIQGLLKQARDGADFAELAKANSEGPTSVKGGDLGLFGRGAMVPSFEKAAFALKVGEVSDVVETQYGYHIIKLTDRKEATNPTFDEVKDKVIEELTQQKQGQIANEYLDSLKAKATIVYPPGKEPEAAEPTLPGASAP